MTAASVGQHRAPLLNRAVSIHSQREASALASLQHSETTPDEGASLSICLELFTEVASLVGPHLKPIRIRRASFSASPAPWGPSPVRGEARRQAETAFVEVRLAQPREAAEWTATAEVQLADSAPAAPVLQLADDRRVERRGTTLNAALLYATPELGIDAGRPLGQAIQWAESLGLGHLAGGIGTRGPHFGTLSASLPLTSTPGVMESVFQLVRWQWYAMTGEGFTVLSLEDAQWYRLPRAEEPLLGHVRCRGSQQGAACFDAVVHGADHRACVEVRGLRILSRPVVPAATALPRTAWQSFVTTLSAGAQAGAS